MTEQPSAPLWAHGFLIMCARPCRGQWDYSARASERGKRHNPSLTIKQHSLTLTVQCCCQWESYLYQSQICVRMISTQEAVNGHLPYYCFDAPIVNQLFFLINFNDIRVCYKVTNVGSLLLCSMYPALTICCRVRKLYFFSQMSILRQVESAIDFCRYWKVFLK